MGGELSDEESVDDYLIRSTFDILDTDHDGGVGFHEFWENYDEFNKGLGLYGRPSLEVSMRAFSKLDRDGDHELEQDEFKEFVEEMRLILELMDDTDAAPAGAAEAMASTAEAYMKDDNPPGPGSLPAAGAKPAWRKDRPKEALKQPEGFAASSGPRDMHRYHTHHHRETADEIAVGILHKKERIEKGHPVHWRERHDINPSVLAMFTALDTNASGTVTINEFLSGFNPILEATFGVSVGGYGIGTISNIFNHLDEEREGHIVVEVSLSLLHTYVSLSKWVEQTM